MADIQLPQYQINTPTPVPQTVSPVAPNPLTALSAGIQQGATLGFQARTVAAQEQERQTQLLQAQAQMAQAKRANQLASLDAFQKQYDALQKINPDHAFDFYQKAMAPLNSEIMNDLGVPADFHSDANPMHETQDKVDQIQAYVKAAATKSMPLPLVLSGLSKIQSDIGTGDYASKRAEEAMKTVGSIQDYAKNQQDLAQKWVTNNQSLRGDQVYKGLETQRNSAAQGYDTLLKNKKPDGSYDLSNGQIIDLYGQLWKSQTGGVLSPSELDEMNQASVQKNTAKLAGLIGLSKNALPTQVGKRLETMFTNLGEFTEKQHASMEASKAAQPGGLVDPEEIKGAKAALGRGLTFSQLKAQSDQDYAQRSGGNTVQRIGKDGKTYTYTLNPKTGKYE